MRGVTAYEAKGLLAEGKDDFIEDVVQDTEKEGKRIRAINGLLGYVDGVKVLISCIGIKIRSLRNRST